MVWSCPPTTMWMPAARSTSCMSVIQSKCVRATIISAPCVFRDAISDGAMTFDEYSKPWYVCTPVLLFKSIVRPTSPIRTLRPLASGAVSVTALLFSLLPYLKSCAFALQVHMKAHQ
jgi:hypothetical protein